MARMTGRTKTRRTKTRGETVSQFDKQVNDLLARAMEQPGVADVMAIYRDAQQTTDAAQASMGPLQPQWVYQATNTSSSS